jgi:hypothetical protein
MRAMPRSAKQKPSMVPHVTLSVRVRNAMIATITGEVATRTAASPPEMILSPQYKSAVPIALRIPLIASQPACFRVTGPTALGKNDRSIPSTMAARV